MHVQSFTRRMVNVGSSMDNVHNLLHANAFGDEHNASPAAPFR